MPGNETQSKSVKAYLPAVWSKTGFTAGQTVGVAMAIAGFPAAITAIPVPRRTSLLSVAVLLSAAVTGGLIRFEITKNGVATGKTFDMTSASGTRKLWEFEPGTLVANKGDEIGILWGSSVGLTPSGTISGVLFCEVQDA